MFGEQVLLSVRYGDWVEVNDEAQAKNWARYWKPEIQGYIHAYRAATGVDLASAPSRRGRPRPSSSAALGAARAADGGADAEAAGTRYDLNASTPAGRDGDGR